MAAGLLGGLAGAITAAGPTVQTLGQGLQINEIAKLQNARNDAAQTLVNGLPDEYASLKQAGSASGDWLWALGLMSGPEGAELQRQHYAATVKNLMDSGMSAQDAAALASLQEGDPETFAKLSGAAAKAEKGGTIQDKRSYLASRFGSMPKELQDDTRKFLDDPNGSDYDADKLVDRLKGYDAKRFDVTTKPYEATIGGKTYKGEEEEHPEEPPAGGEYSPPSAATGDTPAAAPGPGAPIPPAAPGSSAGSLAPPPPPPPVGDPAAAAAASAVPVVPGVRNLHEVPGPAAAQQTLIQKNLQVMGPTSLDIQKKALALGGGDINKAQKIFDGTIGSRAVSGFLGRYPPQVAEVMHAIETFNSRQPNALRSSQSLPLSRYGMAHQENPIKASTDFWSLMSIIQDTTDTVSQSLQMNGWTPDPSFGKVETVPMLRAEAAAGGGGKSASASIRDPHGRSMSFRPD